jgi:hypothetical protein
MKHVRKAVIAASAFTCAVLFSFGWSQQEGISLSVESAQARIGRPLTPMSVAGVARRQNRRAAYGYGAGVVGAGVAGAAALGTAAAVAATSPNWGWGGSPYYGSTGYYGGGPYGGGVWGARAAYYGGPAPAIAATSPYWGWGGNPYQTGTGYYAGGPYYGGNVRGARAAYYGGPSAAWGGASSSDRAQYIKNQHDSGYDPRNNFNADGTIKTN